MVQRRLLHRRRDAQRLRRVDDDPDGLWGSGDFRDGRNLQPAVYLHGGAVPHRGEERSVGLRDAGGADGGDTRAVRGGARGADTVPRVRSLRGGRRDARVFAAGDFE